MLIVEMYIMDPKVPAGEKLFAGIKRPWDIYTGKVSAPNLLNHNCLPGVRASMTRPSKTDMI